MISFYFLCLKFVFLSAFAELPVAGRVYTDQYLYTKPETGSSLAQSSASFWLDFDYHPEHRLGGRLVNQLDIFYRDLNHRDSSSVEYQIREAYISFFGEGSSLKVGQQIIPWGKSDGINPTDYFTAKNYTLLNPDEEVKRLGAPGLNWIYTPEAGNSPLSLQVVIQAYYPQMKFIIPSSVVPIGLTFHRYPAAPLPFQRNSLEAGVKISYARSNFDFSVSAFHGFTQFPEYVFVPQTQSIDAINPEENAFGADASTSISDVILRAESAVHLPVNGSSSDSLFGLVEPYHWDTVLGVEKPFLIDFRVQVQLLYRYHFSYAQVPYGKSVDPLVNQLQQAIARANATLLNYRRQGNPGATFRLSFAKDSSRWRGDLFLIGYFSNNQDFVLRPQVGYSPFDNFTLLAGLDLYGGDPNGTLGVLHSQSDGFFEAKYVF